MLKANESGQMPSVADADEVRLIGLAAAGNLRAFETLYRRYFPRLTRFVERMTRHPQVTDEIVNDTMLVVWQKANTFNLTCKVSTWIFAIAYRKALKAVRLLDEPLECDFERCLDETGHEPENEAGHHELQAILSRALDMLSVEQRAVVCLTYFHGLEYSEIAAVIDCPVNTVKTRMFHARRRLETLLASRKEEM
jgi:RNA polymerase sigma-70 factor (ECF subfamily)